MAKEKDENVSVKRLPQAKVECTVVFTEEEVRPAEEKALHELGRTMEMSGFRKGHVPIATVKEKVDPGMLLEQTVQALLPKTFERLVEGHEIKPIVPPRVEAMKLKPLTLLITFFEKPEVKLKGIKKIAIEKKESKVEAKEIDRMVDYVLAQHRKTREVDREAKQGDQITMDFWGADAEGKEISGIRTTDHVVTIGGATLIPGFEDALKGMKKGEAKSFTLTFPEKYHAENLQGKPVTFSVTVTKIEEVETPALTDEFVRKNLGGNSVAAFRKEVEESMRAQEEEVEAQRRERLLLEELRKATHVDLAPELIEEEARELLREFTEQLKRQNMELAAWMQRAKKTSEDMQKEMRERGKDRLTLRLGMQKLVEEKEVAVTDEEMANIVERFLSRASVEQRHEVEAAYRKGERAYEQLKWQTMVERVMNEMLTR